MTIRKINMAMRKTGRSATPRYAAQPLINPIRKIGTTIGKKATGVMISGLKGYVKATNKAADILRKRRK